MAVPNRLRYEVFRRDAYTCRYCGAKAPDVEITIDHVVPKVLGGSDTDPANLLTACRPCNGGKTSTTPDAPLVANVSADAVRWSSAMRAASARMLADINARSAEREQFRAWWDAWGTGAGDSRQPVPIDPDWESTVDQFIAAGLPLAVLKTCIDSAMRRRKIGPEQTFRYMCGIAWKKVAELRDLASGIAGGGQASDDEELPPSVMAGRADLAREMLGALGMAETGRLLAEARDDRQAETDDEQAIEAAHIAWIEKRVGLDWLVASVCDTLMSSTDNVIIKAMHLARVELFDDEGPGFTNEKFAQAALDKAKRLYEEQDATVYLSALPEGERAEWIAYANAACAAPGRTLSGHSAIFMPAWCARAVKAGNAPFRGMCLAKGDHIERCPRKATQALRLAECERCQEPGEEHGAHLLCEPHADMLEAGELLRDGKRVTVILRGPVNEEEVAAPF